MLVNVADGSVHVKLYDPNKPASGIRRVAPVIALNIDRGTSVDILPYFNGSLEKAHASVKHSTDLLDHITTRRLIIHVSDDNNNTVDIDKILKEQEARKPVETVPPPKGNSTEITRPDLELAKVLATQDQFEASKRGDANPPRPFKKYTKPELDILTKSKLIRLANTKFGLKLDKRDTKEHIVDSILGAQ